MLKRMSASLFSAILYCFSSVMLILSLLFSIQLTALSDRATELKRQIEEIEAENAKLLLRYEALVNMEEIEHYAVDVLGMQPGSSAQTEYIFLSEQAE